MAHDNNRFLEEMFPLPPGFKLHTHKFGSNPTMPHQQTPWGAAERSANFQLQHENPTLGLLAVVREDLNSHHLVAETFSSNPDHLKRAAVSLAIVGTGIERMVHKTIPLNVEENGKYRCKGSADFGKLDDLVRDLGDQLGLIVFLIL